MSVMLGMALLTFGFLSAHFNAASIAPSRLRAQYPFCQGQTDLKPPAMTFMATMPTPALTADSTSVSIAGSKVKL